MRGGGHSANDGRQLNREHVLSFTTARRVADPFMKLACATGGLWKFAPPFDGAAFLANVAQYSAFLAAYRPHTGNVSWHGPSAQHLNTNRSNNGSSSNNSSSSGGGLTGAVAVVQDEVYVLRWLVVGNRAVSVARVRFFWLLPITPYSDGLYVCPVFWLGWSEWSVWS